MYYIFNKNEIFAELTKIFVKLHKMTNLLNIFCRNNRYVYTLTPNVFKVFYNKFT
ncbi:MAG: hypothetical protein ACI9SJ_001011 [Flavobacteriaceae bacterium]|jgi:hypothetical protein